MFAVNQSFSCSIIGEASSMEHYSASIASIIFSRRLFPFFLHFFCLTYSSISLSLSLSLSASLILWIVLLRSLDAQGHLRLTDFGLAKSGITGTYSSPSTFDRNVFSSCTLNNYVFLHLSLL